MSYEVKLTDKVEKDIVRHRKSGNRKLAEKILHFTREMRNNPRFGTGKPERLKECEVETWSRRIDEKHRLIYEIHENQLIVIAISAYGHYEDK